MITSSQVGADSPSSGRSMEIVIFSSLIDSNICIVFWFEQNYAVLSKNYAPVLMSLNLKECQDIKTATQRPRTPCSRLDHRDNGDNG